MFVSFNSRIVSFVDNEKSYNRNDIRIKFKLPQKFVLVIAIYEKNMADIFESIFRKYLTSL